MPKSSRRHRALRTTALIIALLVAIAAPVWATSSVNPDGEVGPNDFRISDMGPDGSPFFRASDSAVAYNPSARRFLVVWVGEDTSGEFEIFGQIVSAEGAEIGPDFRISDMGPDGDIDYGAFTPAVAYNPDTNRFLVVWTGDDDTDPLVNEEFEIFGQMLNGASGSPVGPNDFRISNMGPDGNASFGAHAAASVAYNSVNDRYLVAWRADDDTPPLVNDEFEIFAQIVDGPTGSLVGTGFRISDMGPDGTSAYGAGPPSVAYNGVENEFLVVWNGDDNTPPLVDDELEIFGQRLDGVSGSQVGANDFRISDMGPDGDADYAAGGADVAYQDGYLVVWTGDDGTPPLVNDEFEIFGQRLSPAGAPIGANDFRISDMGPDGSTAFAAFESAVAADPEAGEYLTVWYGDDDTPPLVVNEFEVFGQRIAAGTGAHVGQNDMRLSDAGQSGTQAGGALFPDVAHGGPYLVVWDGTDNIPPLVEGEFEIFGQLFAPPPGDTTGLVNVAAGVWYLRDTAGGVVNFGYGNPNDLPISGDWDGDGDTTPGLYRQADGFFYARNTNNTGIADAECFAGDPSDIPVVGDWDGDGDDNLGIYRPAQQTFYLFTTTCTGSPMGAAQIVMAFGNPGDKPVAGDWDGDGIDEVGLHRESTGFFYWRNTLDTGVASGQIFFGDPGDRFASGDWGIIDGVDTPAVYRPSNQTFYFRHTLTEGVADSQFTWSGAGAGWLPVSGNFGLG